MQVIKKKKNWTSLTSNPPPEMDVPSSEHMKHKIQLTLAETENWRKEFDFAISSKIPHTKTTSTIKLTLTMFNLNIAEIIRQEIVKRCLKNQISN